MKKALIPLFFLCTIWFGFGQLTIVESNTKKAFKESFFLSRETIYLNLNKSSFIKGEEIWFKAYLYNNQKNLPFKETTNLYVSLYDSIGRQTTKRLFRVSEGLARGNIKLDSTIKSGKYYLKASTNWM